MNLLISLLLLFLQAETKSVDWTTVILVITNVLGPVVTYLGARKQFLANLEDSTTKTSFLKLDKVVQLMDKVEDAQGKLINFRDHHQRFRQRARKVEDSYRDFYKDVSEVFDLVVEICSEAEDKHIGILTRIVQIRKTGDELAKIKLDEDEEEGI